MELSLSGNSLKTLHRCVTCLARIGSELAFHIIPSQVAFHTLNSSRSAYQTFTFKHNFFDSFTILSSQRPDIRCSVLLKSICSIFRTSVSSVSLLCIRLSSPDAAKLQWTLHCLNGARKTYWISCNVEPEIQRLSLDRRRLQSSFVVRPRDLTRLLSNFQSSLQEITIISTDPSLVLSGEIGGKAVEIRSYIDPAKDHSDATLHTQLWINPAEEFLQYQHAGDPVDITFSLKELKAFLSFCEGSEVDIHLFFNKAGEPILMAPRFGFDDGSNSDFDTTLVLATLLISLLGETNASDQPHAAPVAQGSDTGRLFSQSKHSKAAGSLLDCAHLSDQTKIWSDLSGPAARSPENNRARMAPVEENPISDSSQRTALMNASIIPPAKEVELDIQQPDGPHNFAELHGRSNPNENPSLQHYPSNWAVPDDDDDDDDDEGDELYVQSTPV